MNKNQVTKGYKSVIIPVLNGQPENRHVKQWNHGISKAWAKLKLTGRPQFPS